MKSKVIALFRKLLGISNTVWDRLIAPVLADTARDVVAQIATQALPRIAAAQLSGLPGSQKAEMVRKDLRAIFKSVPDNMINFGIETAVREFKSANPPKATLAE